MKIKHCKEPPEIWQRILKRKSKIQKFENVRIGITDKPIFIYLNNSTSNNQNNLLAERDEELSKLRLNLDEATNNSKNLEYTNTQLNQTITELKSQITNLENKSDLYTLLFKNDSHLFQL